METDIHGVSKEKDDILEVLRQIRETIDDKVKKIVDFEFGETLDHTDVMITSYSITVEREYKGLTLLICYNSDAEAYKLFIGKGNECVASSVKLHINDVIFNVWADLILAVLNEEV